MTSAHAPVPVHPPLHPPNVWFAPGVAVSVTVVPCANVAEHVPVVASPALVHAMPAGTDVTVPEPLAIVTVSARLASANVAVTDRASVIVTTHAPVPEQAPDQPVNVLVAEVAVAVRVTCVPWSNGSAQSPLFCPLVAVHAMPAGAEAIVPLPDPPTSTVRSRFRSVN